MMQLDIITIFSMLLQVGELIEGIFKAGFWTAIIVVVLVIGVIIWVVKKLRGRSQP